MRAAEFDALGLVELEALTAAWKTRIVREDLRAGVLASMIANALRGKDDIAAHPADFFASLEDLRPGPLTAEQMEAKLDSVFGAVNRDHDRKVTDAESG